MHIAETIQGGQASYLNETVPAQARKFGDDAVRVVVPEDHVCELTGVTRDVARTFPARGGRVQRSIELARVVRQRYRVERPGIVHAHGTFAGVVARLPGIIGRDTSIVYCPHGWSFDRAGPAWSRRAFQVIERMLARRCAAIVCISAHERTRGVAARLPSRKLVMIRNGVGEAVESNNSPSWPAGARRLLFVGRFDRQKGADVFFSAMRRLGNGFFAYCVGDAVLNDARLLNLPSNIRTTGWLNRSEVTAYMRSADILIVPSRWEGFGLVAIEAMRVGTPVIASRVGGLVEVVSDGETGRLIEPNSADAIVKAVLDLHESDCQRMGSASRRRFLEQFSADRMNEEIVALYDRLARGLDAVEGVRT